MARGMERASSSMLMERSETFRNMLAIPHRANAPNQGECAGSVGVSGCLYCLRQQALARSEVKAGMGSACCWKGCNSRNWMKALLE